ncbi:MAG TPA: hypothetical protein VKR30_11695 [Candidatus Limnocylindrales bacterium]|nr:hypothetical protein [Candidatus Limnocylindrales bacterium]
MDRWSIPVGQLEASFARASVLQREIERKERLLGRRIQVVAKGLADLMQPGEMHHRRGVGLHAFPVDGLLCLAAAYLEEEGERYRYRYAVLCGGEAAKRALKTADLDPGDSDEPGSRRVALATYDDYVAFVERLPAYLGDVTREMEARLREAESAEATAGQVGREITARARRTRSGGNADPSPRKR